MSDHYGGKLILDVFLLDQKVRLLLIKLLPRLTEMSVNARDLTDILGKSEISIDKLTENLDSIEMLGDSVLRLEASSKEMLNKVNKNSFP